MKFINEITLAKRPEGLPTSENFKIVKRAVPDLNDGEILVKNLFLTVDPYMRGRMNDVKSYVPPFQLGEAMEGGAVGEVVQSRNSKYSVGTKLLSSNGWRDGWVGDGKAVMIVDESVDVPASLWLGVLGMPGMTAWAGLLKAAQLKSGDTVFVSGAAGAVGSLVGQIAKLKGCRAIGSAGGPEKVAFLSDLGFDGAFDYRGADLVQELRKHAPDGIDVYFDNVGSTHLQAALSVMNGGGRVALCGAIEQYNNTSLPVGPNNLFLAISKSLNLKGFIVNDYNEFRKDFIQEMIGWVSQGKIKAEETIFEGLDKTPEAFLGLFSGINKGKMIVKI